jgi:hypothetical protein
MRYLTSIVACMLLMPMAHGSDPRATQLITKAIDAHGGPQRLELLQDFHVRSKGTFQVPGRTDVDFDQEYWFKSPDCQRVDLSLAVNGQLISVRIIYNNADCWNYINGKLTELPRNVIKSASEKCHIMMTLTLTPLLDKDRFRVEYLGERVFDEQATLGVRVFSEPHWPFEMFFCKKAHLLVRIQSHEYDEKGIEKYQVSNTFSGHKDFHGLKYPGKTIRIGRGDARTIEEVVRFIPLKSTSAAPFDGNIRLK